MAEFPVFLPDPVEVAVAMTLVSEVVCQTKALLRFYLLVTISPVTPAFFYLVEPICVEYLHLLDVHVLYEFVQM